MTKRTCVFDGCAKPYRAKGMCSTHYNRTFDPERHAPVATPCTVCGKVVMKHKAYAGRRPVCSSRCRRFVQFGAFGHEGKELVGPIQVEKSTEADVTVVASTPRGFVSHSCGHCGVGFLFDWRTTGTAPRFCTVRCTRRWHRARHRRRQGRFAPTRAERLAIYERDDWTCQLCFEPVEPDADPASDWFPTLDHIECQSWALVPDHSPSNLRLAHRWCNSVRGDESHHSAADLIPA